MIRNNLVIIKWLNFGFGIFNTVMAILAHLAQSPAIKTFMIAAIIHAVAFDLMVHTIRKIDKKDQPPDIKE